MENYIVINGKKAELTPEQLKALGIEVREKIVFDRVDKGHDYYYITSQGNVTQTFDADMNEDRAHHAVANYCTDKTLMKQRALHETLNRLLWRYSMEHEGDKIEWHNDCAKNRTKALIYYDHATQKFDVYTRWDCQFFGCVWFNTYEIAKNAIEEIVMPFMAEHPEFKW